MKTPIRFFLAAALILTAQAVRAADPPLLLAIPGKILYENSFAAALAEPWKVAKGSWDLTEGAWRAAEIPTDKHPAVARLSNKLGDFVLQYEFKFVGGKSTCLSINAPKGHMARITITPTQVSIQKDDSDREGPDKGLVFVKLPAEFAPGSWHKVRLEMVGDTLLGRVDDLTGWGAQDSFKLERTAGLTMTGQVVEFRNFSIREATLNPEWERLKADVPSVAKKEAKPQSPTESSK